MTSSHSNPGSRTSYTQNKGRTMKTIVGLIVIVAIAFGQSNAILSGKWERFSAYNKAPPTPQPKSTFAVLEKWIDQRVDNFDPQNLATFQTRYYENDEFFQADGPLFVFIGGEWTIDRGQLLGGHMFDMAQELNGSQFYPEHRYYGISFPVADLSDDNLRFLTVDQALVDLANFLVTVKQEPRYARSKVVLVGGSYSATMAAWFRQMYPHLAVGAWASSAPVLAKVDFVEYKEVVGAAFYNHGSRACHDRLANAFADAEALIAANRFEEFRQLFGLCEGFDTEMDVANAFSTFSDVLAGIVQYHRYTTIGNACNSILRNTTEESTDLSEFARFFREYIGLDGAEQCLENYDETIAYFRNSSLTSSAAQSSMRQWVYQTCAEFGWYQTSGSTYQPFGSSFPVEFYTQMCADIYPASRFTHDRVHELVDRKNVVFGGWQSQVRNVYFTNGLVDPWRTMSIQADLNPSSPADVIPGASHCQDLASASAGDSVEMAAVKERIRLLVRLWLGDYAVPY